MRKKVVRSPTREISYNHTDTYAYTKGNGYIFFFLFPNIWLVTDICCDFCFARLFFKSNIKINVWILERQDGDSDIYIYIDCFFYVDIHMSLIRVSENVHNTALYVFI